MNADTPLSELKVGELRHLLQAGPEIPLDREYTVEEVRIRLVSGRDPAYMDEEEKAMWKEKAVSETTIYRLCAAGILKKIKVGARRAFITEASVRQYKKGKAKGWIDGFRVVNKRKYHR